MAFLFLSLDVDILHTYTKKYTIDTSIPLRWCVTKVLKVMFPGVVSVIW